MSLAIFTLTASKDTMNDENCFDFKNEKNTFQDLDITEVGLIPL